MTFAQLVIEQGTGENIPNTIIKVNTGEFLAIVRNVNAGALDSLDFKPVDF